jgi:hypothetical protein
MSSSLRVAAALIVLLPAGAVAATPVESKSVPYEVEYENKPPGNGYTLCELFVKNLEATPKGAPPPNCELTIYPKYRKYFSLPQWEDLDPWQHIDWLWKMDVQAQGGVPPDRPVDKMSRDEWYAWFEERIRKKRLVVTLKRARFDLNGDGKEETVLGYLARRQPCDPWRDGFAGFDLFILKDDQQTLDLDVTQWLGHPRLIFFSSLKHRYSFMDHPPDGVHTFQFESDIPGDFQEMRIEISQGGGSVEQVPVCRIDVKRKPARSFKQR